MGSATILLVGGTHGLFAGPAQPQTPFSDIFTSKAYAQAATNTASMNRFESAPAGGETFPGSGAYLVDGQQAMSAAIQAGQKQMADKKIDAFRLEAIPPEWTDAEDAYLKYIRTDRYPKGLKGEYPDGSFVWGPKLNDTKIEDYADVDGGKVTTKYLDKGGIQEFKKNGKEVVSSSQAAIELISGQLRVGDSKVINKGKSAVGMAGDQDDTLAPTYAAFDKVSNTPNGNHFAENKTGQYVAQAMDRNGNVSEAAGNLTTKYKNAHYENATKHNIP